MQVCSHGDQYACVAYFNNRWVIYFPSEQQVKKLIIYLLRDTSKLFDLWLSDWVLPVQVIGDWDSVINTFIRLNMRPDILFFENVSCLLCFFFFFCFLMCTCVYSTLYLLGISGYAEEADCERPDKYTKWCEKYVYTKLGPTAKFYVFPSASILLIGMT